MAELAAAENVTLDAIDSDGRDERFGRPDPEHRTRGPLAESLQGRLSGSSAAVDDAGASVTQRTDSARANARVNDGPAT